MIMRISLVLSLVSIIQIHGRPSANLAIEQLNRKRAEFDKVLNQPKEFIGYTTANSEMLGGAHGDALYPIGSAAERFVISFDETGGGKLIYEKRRRNNARIKCAVQLVPLKGSSPSHGTLEKYLKQQHFMISPRAHLTVRERKQLKRIEAFACFGYHPMMGGYAWLVLPDGSNTASIRSTKPYTATPQEIKLLINKK